jgi:beta-lactamase class A
MSSEGAVVPTVETKQTAKDGRKGILPLIGIVGGAIVLLAIMAVFVLIVLPHFSNNEIAQGENENSKTLIGEGSKEAQELNIEVAQAFNGNFPTVDLYLSVLDTEGLAVEGFAAEDFTITEIVGGATYEATIDSLLPLGEADAMSISLVLDQSGSMDDSGKMADAKNAASTFVEEIVSSANNSVAIMSFDDYVYNLLNFSKDEKDVVSAISGIRPTGGTALYDALFAALQKTNQEKGSRFVIAFTDGMENASIHTEQQIIDLSRLTGIPVYLVGVGDEIDSGALQQLAIACRGQYFSVGVSDIKTQLLAMYDQIYQEQRSMYKLTYTSSCEEDQYQFRDVELNSTGDSMFVGSATVSYIPHDSPIDKVDMTSIERIITEANTGGTAGIAAVDATSATVIKNGAGDAALKASALISIPIMITIEDDVRNGIISLDDTMVFRHTVGGRGGLKAEEDGNSVSIRTLIEYMLSYSDNNAINTLMENLGIKHINETCHQLGYTSVSLERPITLQDDPRDNYLSANDLVLMYKQLYFDSTVFGQGFMDSNFAIQDSAARRGLGKYLPTTYQFLNFNGVTDDKYTELAMISDGQNTYVVAFLGNDAKQDYLAELAANIGRYIGECLAAE